MTAGCYYAWLLLECRLCSATASREKRRQQRERGIDGTIADGADAEGKKKKRLLRHSQRIESVVVEVSMNLNLQFNISYTCTIQPIENKRQLY